MGAVGRAASAQGTKQVSWKGHDQWKREKYDPYSSDVQGKAGELTGAAYRTAEQVPKFVEHVGKEINKGMQAVGLMPGDKSGAGGSDGSSGANYTSSTGKSSQGSGKGADLSDTKKKNVKGKGSLYKKGPK